MPLAALSPTTLALEESEGDANPDILNLPQQALEIYQVMAYTHVLEALADPTRRLLFERLRRRPHTVGELAELARIRQPTVSQHLRRLRQARLVTDRREGTRRFYSADRTGLAELRAYVESMWDDVLAAYAAQPAQPGAADETRPARASKRGRSK